MIKKIEKSIDRRLRGEEAMGGAHHSGESRWRIWPVVIRVYLVYVGEDCNSFMGCLVQLYIHTYIHWSY